LDEYFSGSRRQFELEFEYSGSDFQLGVWKELTKIPFGETMTYKDIADAVGSPSSCRAVGAACGRNPMAIFIPCHRVVGSDGSLTGYAGGLEIKKKLLELERKYAPSV
jgi:methylated-DNA-[protein]-cysteine S-methyltransferase